ncbi:NucA/NucB deoxyribonuclease domain-containing protein [Nonomuraea endophytica]|uniref:Deoxyribonuclease NucA/NucB domain-containing protein n=1 Tax=Nonomuraea endophytica TaxID=714136 RepID=A0A7W8ACZ3_9ACTN|nr:NucA/NucB deoxyribonuclease domain-containing protein [Nonomuraea endophytica]MBB5084002.1 hypothetical protein [Nonomuraea endophytica]
MAAATLVTQLITAVPATAEPVEQADPPVLVISGNPVDIPAGESREGVIPASYARWDGKTLYLDPPGDPRLAEEADPRTRALEGEQTAPFLTGSPEEPAWEEDVPPGELTEDDAEFTEGATTFAQKPPRRPSQALVAFCKDAKSGKYGIFRSRFVWCEHYVGWRITINARTRLPSVTLINHTYYGFGRDDGRRQVKIFMKPTFVFSIGPDHRPSDQYGFVPACIPGGSTPGCAVPTMMRTKSLTGWRAAIPGAGGFVSWLVTSDETQGHAAEKWSYHKIVFAMGKSGLISAWSSTDYMLRCDSATYISGARQKACLFHDVVPRIQYALFDADGSRSDVHDVANHIQTALTQPDITYPRESHPKRIPGKYTNPPDLNSVLERVAYNGPEWTANAATKSRACHRRGEYRLTGLPGPPASGQQCDEFPFATTVQGASNPSWDFSVAWVDRDDNHQAGQELKAFYRRQRILYKDLDLFYVHVVQKH